MFTLSSCTEWLTVTSDTDVLESDLYSTGDGFRQATNGLYNILAKSSLYGRELTWGWSTVCAELYNWDDLSTNNMLLYVIYSGFTTTYDHTDEDICDMVYDNIWSNAYNCVANTNNLLEYALESEADIFEFGDYERDIIIGECYAIRALMHFEILRLFGGALYEEEATEARVPYVTDFDTKVPTYYDTQGILDLIIEDLTTAREYLYDWDMRVIGRFGGNQFNEDINIDEYDEYNTLFMGCRGSRMNYLASTLLLARAYLYAGDYDNAYIFASEVYSYSYFGENKKMSYTSMSSLTEDKTLAGKIWNEILFAAVDYDMYDNYQYYVNLDDDFLRIDTPTQYFGSDTDDTRYTVMIETLTTSTTRWSNEGTYEMLMPVMRVSEAYHILAECMLTSSCSYYDRDAAVNLMYYFRYYCRQVNANFVEQTASLSDYEVLQLVWEDVIRERMDDGYVSWLYKRTGVGFNYVTGPLPIPEEETDYLSL